MALRAISLCSGIGGLDLGLAEWCRAVCYVERDAFAASLLVARMEEAALDLAPIADDLRSFDGRAWRGAVDLVVGGYPCQPFSQAGRRLGADDERHLWPHVRRILAECDAPLAFFENVRGHLSLGFADVLADLAGLGFDAEWTCLRASDVGAPHERERLFVLAYRHGDGLEVLRRSVVLDRERTALRDDADGCGSDVADADDPERRPRESSWHDRDGRDAVWNQEAGGSPGDRAALADSGLRRRIVAERLGHEAQSAPRPTGDEMGDAANGSARRAGIRQATPDDLESVGNAARTRSSQRHDRGHLRGISSAFPPGPHNRDGWREWIERGGPQPVLRRGVDGPAAFVDRADRLRCLGNAVVPAQARAAFNELLGRFQ